MKPLQREHKVIDVGHAVSLAAQPAYEFEPELCREASQVAEPHLLQEVTSVAPQHHVDIHVLCALPIPTVGPEFRRDDVTVTASIIPCKSLMLCLCTP